MKCAEARGEEGWLVFLVSEGRHSPSSWSSGRAGPAQGVWLRSWPPESGSPHGARRLRDADDKIWVSMRIHLLEPFFGGSHQQWASALQRHSSHEVELLTLPGSFWKWRMWGGAVALARRYCEGLPLPDLWVATDMLDLAAFLGLVHQVPGAGQVPTLAYFHENQLTYPWSPHDADVHAERHLQYAFINFTTALAADRVCFNSAYHRDEFLNRLPAMLGRFPDRRQRRLVPLLRDKSEVMPLGLELHALDALREEPDAGPPIVLWNHRWEYDKGPEMFFEALIQLATEGVPFRLVVLGQHFQRVPDVFARAKALLAPRILHWGYVEDKNAYYRWLWRADVLPVTSAHDFFGISVIEAVWCMCWPLLPCRLVYPEHFPESLFLEHYYKRQEDFLPALRHLLLEWRPQRRDEVAACRQALAHYDWSVQGPRYDTLFAQVVSEGRRRR